MKPFEVHNIENHDGWHRTFFACIHERWVIFVSRAEYVELHGVAIEKETFTLNVWDPHQRDTDIEITDTRDFDYYCNETSIEDELVVRELYYTKSDLMARISELYIHLDRGVN